MSASNGRPTVLLPYSEEELGGLRSKLDVIVWDGESKAPEPSGLTRVEFFVVPYPPTPAAIALTQRMPQLKVVQVLTAGVDNVVLQIPAGVTLCNARGVHNTSVAELTLALVLASQRGVPEFARNQERGKWEPAWNPALADRTVLILGYGAIGEAIEQRLVGFECDVLRVGRSAREAPRGKVYADAELPDLLPRADVVVLTLPLTKATHGLVGARFLARMREGALLVNVGRGALVDTNALLAELRSGRLRAALDVTDPEPLPADHPLWQSPGVLVSPHVGGFSSAFKPRAQRLIVEQLARYASGESLANVVASDR